MSKQTVWSASKLGTLFGCASAYKYHYVEHIKVPTNIRAVFGAAIHHMLEDFYKKNYLSSDTFCNSWDFYWNLICDIRSIEKVQETSPKIAKLYKSIKGRYGEVNIHNKEARPYIVSAYKKTGRQILTKFYNRHKNKPAPIAFEKRFSLEFRGFKIRGVIDRLDEFKGGLCISDYKTDKKCPQQNDLLLRRHHQFTIYDLALNELYHLKPTGIFMYHLRSGSIIPTKRTEEDFEYLESCLKRAERTVKNQEFEPFFGFHCNMCDFIPACKKKEVEDLNLTEIINQEESDLFWGLEDRLN